MLDENGFERDTAPSSWVMVAIWASVPVAALAFGLAIVAVFGIQRATNERDVTAARPARVRQAELAAPRTAAAVAEAKEASVPRTPPQVAAREASGPSPLEPARDHRPAQVAASDIVRPEPPAEAMSPPRTEGEEALQADVQSLPTQLPIVAARGAVPEPSLPQVSHPQGADPHALRWPTVGPALAALSVPPMPSVEARAETTPPGRAAPVSNLPPTAEPVLGRAPETGLAQNWMGVADRVSVVAPVPASSRVFIHQPSNARGGAAEALARRLGRQGVSVAAIRPVQATPSAPEIRYFHEADRAAAGTLARQLAGPTWRVRDFLSYAKPPRPGTLEIWLPNGTAVGAD